MSRMFSRCLGKWRSTLVFQTMLPLELVVPSTLYALTCLSSFFKGNWVSAMSPGLMKLPVAPQLMMAVVSMIWLFTEIFTGMRKVLSFGRAVNTWLTWEDDIETSSRVKNPEVLQRFLRPSLLLLPHSIVSGFEEVLPPSFQEIVRTS